MSNQKLKAEQFRALHVAGSPLVLFNIWDAGSAKAIAAGGATAIATGSWSVAAANGFTDGEHFPFDFALENLQRIVKATELPVSVDLESGYGNDPAAVRRAVARAITAGAVGCNLEDSIPGTGSLRELDDQIARLSQARASADDSEIPFFINARTDVFLLAPAASHNNALLSGAIERGLSFASAGANGLFLPGLIDPALIERAVRESPLPVNVMMNARLPSLSRLADLGVARVSHGPGPFIQSMKLLEDAARTAMHQRTTD